MEISTADLNTAIGARIREGRQSRHWTLDQLADAAGVSRRTLFSVEQGTVNPSVGTLLGISDALGVGLPALVAPPLPKPVNVVRRNEGAALWTSGSGGRAVLVAGTGPPDVVELWDWTLGPGDRHASAGHTAGTKELLQVLKGAITVEVEEQSVDLRVGDAVSFRGDVAHAYANEGKRPARFSLAVFEPGVGSEGHRG
jgi:transcriptional regulator with XRE-family HTH domain